MTITEAEEGRRECAIDLLEACVTHMTESGWRNDCRIGDNGERCIVNTLMFVSLRSPRFAFLNSVALNALEETVRRDHACKCSQFQLDSIAHFNDRHCTDGEQAIDVFRSAIKELRG